MALRRSLADRPGLAASLNSLGIVARNRGDFVGARAYFAESLELKQELGDRTDISTTMCCLGLLAVDEGRLDEARELLEASLALDREHGDVVGCAVNRSNLGAVALQQGELEQARVYLAESLRAFDEIGDEDGVAECLEQIAGYAARSGRAECGARLAGAAEALRLALGIPVAPADRARLEAHVDRARQGLPAERFAAAFAAGRALTPSDAVAEALFEVGS